MTVVWASGPGVLGFGDSSDQQTSIDNHVDHVEQSSGSLTWYFRHTFNVNDPGQFSNLRANILRDDGAIVYLNGNEIARSNMPDGPVTINTEASSTVGESAEVAYHPSNCISNQLVPGDNVIAVEVHQRRSTSSDVSFDLELVSPSNPLIRGPYLQNQTPSSIIIRWRTCNATSSRVQWGSSYNNLTDSLEDLVPKTDHELEITNLTPGSQVFYSIGSSSTVFAGADNAHFFVMPPDHGTDQKTRVWVLGDSGDADDDAMAVRDAYTSFNGSNHTDLWLMLGDNAYEDGTDAEYQAAVFDLYPEILKQSVLWPTVGNHDDRSADSMTQTGVYYNIFTLPDQAATKGASTGVDSGTEAYYSFDFANIHFIVLESDERNTTFRANMESWLQLDMAATTAKWVVAIWHHPPYSKGSHNSDTSSTLTYMRTQILPILESFGVDLVLTGHSHSYERSYLIDGHYGLSDTFDPAVHALDSGDGSPLGAGQYSKPTIGKAPHEGTVYIVAGSSSRVGSIDSDAPHEAMRNLLPLQVLGSVVLDIDNNFMDVTFLTSSGSIDDSFRIAKEMDNDGVADDLDNCPAIANPDQANLDNDTFGNLCDDDVDGDGIANDLDLDDDNDFLPDQDEGGSGTDIFNPDTDGDGIVDGLDLEPLVENTFCSGDPAVVDQLISTHIQCAAPTVRVDSNTNIQGPGNLQIFSTQILFQPGFSVQSPGELQVFTTPLNP